MYGYIETMSFTFSLEISILFRKQDANGIDGSSRLLPDPLGFFGLDSRASL